MISPPTVSIAIQRVIAAVMTWFLYGFLIITNLAAGYALGRWWLRSRVAT
jgi:hypothetical protein